MSILLALPLLLTPAPFQAPAELEDLAPLLTPIFEDHVLPALAAAVFDREGMTALGAVGVRSFGGDAAVSPGDRWHLGSCTKAMTATLAARLIEKELCTWDTTIGEVFTDLDDDMHSAWSDVPLWLLLSNRSGAPAKLIGTPLWPLLRAHRGTPREQRRSLVEGVIGSPPQNPPGTKYVYSNAGFCIAGAMLEALADTSWEELVRREVFEPLGMANAGFGPPGTEGELDQPIGHQEREAGPHPMGVGRLADNPQSLGPAGRAHASLADWARFARAHLARDESFLAAETWERLQAPLEDQHYGYGWGFYQRGWADGVTMNHSGSNTMWYCTVWIAPQKGLGLLVATNVGGSAAAKACDEVAVALVDRFSGSDSAGR
jgi:CubicO group peptidase (beta-lactamase class C family)